MITASDLNAARLAAKAALASMPDGLARDVVCRLLRHTTAIADKADRLPGTGVRRKDQTTKAAVTNLKAVALEDVRIFTATGNRDLLPAPILEYFHLADEYARARLHPHARATPSK